MKNWLRNWLGITTLQAKVDYIHADIRHNIYNFEKLRSEVATHNAALARVIAKNEPFFGVDELDPKRRADSDRIGREVLDKLAGETEMQWRYKP